jgi:hypothetical protein
MRSIVCRSLLALTVGAASLWPCDCGLLPVCAYRGADIIFLGRVTFTNHDYSVGLNHSTLVRFEVEESLRGVAAGVHEIWVDPGSFTSCYQEYRLENRYLIFGTRSPAFPEQTAAMTVNPGATGPRKPVPRGIDPSSPPPIYFSPECAGSRHADGSAAFEEDLAMLRAETAGKAMPKVLGDIHLSPYWGWPWLDGPALNGAVIAISNAAVSLKTTTDPTGRFSIQDAPPGEYRVRADLTPYRMDPNPIRFSTTNSVNGYLRIPEAGCGYTEVQLSTASSISGVVLDPSGKGAPKTPVSVRTKGGPFGVRELVAVTDRNGRFTISGVPDADVYLSAGVDADSFPTNMNTRYRAVYYSDGDTTETASPLRLKFGEKRSVVLRLGTPLKWGRVDVKVVDKDGRAKVGANVDLHGVPEIMTTGPRGLGSLRCLAGWKYELEASAWGEHSRPDGKREVLVASRTPLVCGDRKTPIVLVLDHTPHGIVSGQAVDAKGFALGYPSLRMYRDSDTIPRYEVRGDDKGRFRIEDIDPGVYEINIAVQGQGEKTLSRVGVAAGQITNLGAVAWTFRQAPDSEILGAT